MVLKHRQDVILRHEAQKPWENIVVTRSLWAPLQYSLLATLWTSRVSPTARYRLFIHCEQVVHISDQKCHFIHTLAFCCCIILIWKRDFVHLFSVHLVFTYTYILHWKCTMCVRNLTSFSAARVASIRISVLMNSAYTVAKSGVHTQHSNRWQYTWTEHVLLVHWGMLEFVNGK